MRSAISFPLEVGKEVFSSRTCSTMFGTWFPAGPDMVAMAFTEWIPSPPPRCSGSTPGETVTHPVAGAGCDVGSDEPPHPVATTDSATAANASLRRREGRKGHRRPMPPGAYRAVVTEKGTGAPAPACPGRPAGRIRWPLVGPRAPHVRPQDLVGRRTPPRRS